MTAPKRPPLADTIARIDAAIAGQPPRCTLTGHRRDVGSTGPFTSERCTRDALPGTYTCDLHTQPGGILPITDTVADATNAAELGRLWEQAYGPPSSASGAEQDDAAPCLHCARQALRDSPYCAAHKRIPREMIEELGPVEPVVRDGNTFTVTQPGVYLLSNAPAPEPGWLARALRRLGVW